MSFLILLTACAIDCKYIILDCCQFCNWLDWSINTYFSQPINFFVESNLGSCLSAITLGIVERNTTLFALGYCVGKKTKMSKRTLLTVTKCKVKIGSGCHFMSYLPRMARSYSITCTCMAFSYESQLQQTCRKQLVLIIEKWSTASDKKRRLSGYTYVSEIQQFCLSHGWLKICRFLTISENPRLHLVLHHLTYYTNSPHYIVVTTTATIYTPTRHHTTSVKDYINPTVWH